MKRKLNKNKYNCAQSEYKNINVVPFKQTHDKFRTISPLKTQSSSSSSSSSWKIIRRPLQGLSGAVQYNVSQLQKKT